MSTAAVAGVADAHPSVDLGDIQGLLRFGFKHHREACFVLFRVRDRELARDWLRQVPVTSALTRVPVPSTVLQLAFTSEGLRALGVPGDIVDAFSPEFVAGLGHDPNRARRLGDVGANDPGHWQWGTLARVPHVLLMLYATPGRLADWREAVLANCAAAFELLAELPTSDMQGREPFGFTDGISQPALDWQRQRIVRDAERPTYGNLSCLGEHILGFPNEYGLYTDRPLLAPARDPEAMLPRAEDDPGQPDLGRNGSYLVLRQLAQDVPGFWQFVDRAAGGDAARREQLAAAMVGRTREGIPVVGLAGGAAGDLNAFDYGDDPRGLHCPLGAHVRRANPRNGDLPPGPRGLLSWLARTLGLDAQALARDRVASTRFHRILRRGREYGTPLSIEQALRAAPGSVDAGLQFVGLGANLVRQFEFVQSAWVASSHFDGLRGEADPLLGSRAPLADGSPTDAFSLPQPGGADCRLSGLPVFVRVIGGAYFFLPGLRALRWLATAG